MSREPYIIRTPEQRDAIRDLVGKLDVSKPWDVTITPHRKKRSLSQNALMWRWVNDVADYVQRDTGQDAEDVHEFFKQRFLKPSAVEIGGQTVQKYSTKNMTVAEMKTYMDQIYAFVTSELGILLPIPEELGRDQR